MDAFVAQHLKGVSRTYAILIPMLPNGLADAVGLAYLLLRITDTLEDDPRLTTEQRLEHLRRLDAALAELDAQPSTMDAAPPAVEFTPPLGDNDAERELTRATPAVLAKVAALPPAYRDAARACARAMIGGVREMLARSERRGLPYPAVQDAAELRSYCHYVAGVVGEMLCAMMAHYLKSPALNRLRDVAVELGIGLQLVNILKDALKDSRQGRRYLPTDTAGNLSHAEIYRAVLQEARMSLRRGTEFVLALPATAWQLRSFCGLPIAWGAMTLARAERDAGRAKIGRGTVRSSIERFTKLAGDDGALRRWFARLLRIPRHEPEPG